MRKSDLKTGMWVENRNGAIAIVLLNTKDGDIFSGTNVWGPLKDYNDGLSCTCGSDFDIIRIYQPKSNYGYYNYEKHERLRLIWERKEPVTVTLEEIAKWKGVDVDNIRIMPSSVR